MSQTDDLRGALVLLIENLPAVKGEINARGSQLRDSGRDKAAEKLERVTLDIDGFEMRAREFLTLITGAAEVVDG